MVCPSDYSYSSDDDTAYDLIDDPNSPAPIPEAIVDAEANLVDMVMSAAHQLSEKAGPVAVEGADLQLHQMQQEKPGTFSSLDRPAGWTREMAKHHVEKLQEEVESMEMAKENMEAFDMLAIDDEKVIEYSRRIGRELPYDILLESIRMNAAWGATKPEETNVRLGHSKYELTMRVGKHEARVECTSLKNSRHRAAQALLKMLHPGMDTWGSVLRLFSHSSNDDLEETKRNLDGREQRLLADKLAAEALSKRLTAHLEEAELKQKRLETEKKALQDQVIGVYAQIGEKQLNYDNKKEKYEAEITELKQSLQEEKGKVFQLTETLAEKNKENEVLNFNWENDKTIRLSALEKLKRGEAFIKAESKNEVYALRLLVVIFVTMFVLLFTTSKKLEMTYTIGCALTGLVVIVAGSLFYPYENGKWLQSTRKTNVETFIQLATKITSDDDRTRLAPTTATTDSVASAEENTPAGHLKPRTVLLKKDNGSFGISIYGSHIYRVTPGSVADRAGIQAFDQIMAIDDNENVSSEEIINKLEKTADELKMVVRFNPVRRHDAP